MTNGVAPAGYWPSPWPGEDAGPLRLQTAPGVPGPRFDPATATVTSREAIATTMVVLREPGEVFVLRHTAGPDAISWAERIDAVTLETIGRSVDLSGGPIWPGGLAAHANGSLYVVFGEHAHRLSVDLQLLATTELPRHRPYNSFVILPDGCLVTKDFGGVLPQQDPATHVPEPTELVVLHPDDLRVLDRVELAEPSIARLSADGDTVYVVGTNSLLRATWNGHQLEPDGTFAGRYRTAPGQGYGWDAVLALGAAWFLDDGEGSERYVGTLRGQGLATVPLHLVRVDLVTGDVTLTEICGQPGGLVANPPLIDTERRIAVGYDSGNGVLAAFDIADDGTTTRRWRRDQNHACHPLLFADSGELILADHDAGRMADQIVIVDIESGDERLRVDSGSPVQSVVFPAVGWDRDLYYCSFATISRLAASAS